MLVSSFTRSKKNAYVSGHDGGTALPLDLSNQQTGILAY